MWQVHLVNEIQALHLTNLVAKISNGQAVIEYCQINGQIMGKQSNTKSAMMDTTTKSVTIISQKPQVCWYAKIGIFLRIQWKKKHTN